MANDCGWPTCTVIPSSILSLTSRRHQRSSANQSRMRSCSEILQTSGGERSRSICGHPSCVCSWCCLIIRGKSALQAFWQGALDGFGVKAAELATVELEQQDDMAYEVEQYILKG